MIERAFTDDDFEVLKEYHEILQPFERKSGVKETCYVFSKEEMVELIEGIETTTLGRLPMDAIRFYD